ncbi:MAG TPA: hypothetical protein VJS30_31540, partial [Paraburkholderia sp.]|nr:hypothetical protein [Paraburkholderia sp.]
ALDKELRDTLGEDALFPPDQTAKAPVKKKRYVRHVVKKPTEAETAAAPAPAAPAAPAATAPAKAAGNGADPFSALR